MHYEATSIPRVQSQASISRGHDAPATQALRFSAHHSASERQAERLVPTKASRRWEGCIAGHPPALTVTAQIRAQTSVSRDHAVPFRQGLPIIENHACILHLKRDELVLRKQRALKLEAKPPEVPGTL